MKIQRYFKMKSFLSFKGRLLVFALCISLMPIAIITTVYYFYSRSGLRDRVMDHMKSVAEAKEQHVLSFMEKMKGCTVDFSTDGFIIERLDAIIRGKAAKQQEVMSLNKHLLENKLRLSTRLMSIAIVDKRGKVVSSSHEKLIGKDMSGQDVFTQGISRKYGEAYVAQPCYFPELDVNCILVSAPIISKKGADYLGVIINVYNLLVLDEITTNRIGMGETGETYLVNRDKTMLTVSRFIDNAPLKQAVDTEPVRRIIEDGKEMVGIYPDYRGVPIVGASMDMSEYRWILLAEIDKAEAFAPIKTLGIIALILGVVCAAAVTCLGIVFAVSTSRPIKDLINATERFAGGELDYRVKIPRRDEIGTLASSFNAMAEEISEEITEHKRMEEVLQKSEEKFHSVVSTATDAIILADASGNVILWNEGARKMFGYAEDEVVGKELAILMPERYRDAHERGLEKVRLTGESKLYGKPVEVDGLKKDGSEFPIELTVSFWYTKEGTFYTGIIRDITERKKLQDELARLATTDALTGIFNRRKMDELLGMEINKAMRYKSHLSFIMFDIDHFKMVNDAYGHNVGDSVLRTLVEIVKRNLRNTDYFCRWGGEEFLILSPETDLENATALAERLRIATEKHSFEGVNRITISLGVTQFSKKDGVDSFLMRVDDALYIAKNRGRNRVEISTSTA